MKIYNFKFINKKIFMSSQTLEKFGLTIRNTFIDYYMPKLKEELKRCTSCPIFKFSKINK